MKNIREAKAEELEGFKQSVRRAFEVRSTGERHRQAWHEAARRLHASYDRLAFPGGLAHQFERLQKGDLEAIEMAVKFLEADPWYFRSGYYKAETLKYLKRYALSQGQCARLREVLLSRVWGRPVREFRAYCRLASKISTPEFEIELGRIARESNSRASRHAAWVLEYLARSQAAPTTRG
jgi:hypothetical protein